MWREPTWWQRICSECRESRQRRGLLTGTVVECPQPTPQVGRGTQNSNDVSQECSHSEDSCGSQNERPALSLFLPFVFPSFSLSLEMSSWIELICFLGDLTVQYSKSPTYEPSSCKLSRMRMYYNPITVQYSTADCVSWAPRLTLLDLRTNWT